MHHRMTEVLAARLLRGCWAKSYTKPNTGGQEGPLRKQDNLCCSEWLPQIVQCSQLFLLAQPLDHRRRGLEDALFVLSCRDYHKKTGHLYEHSHTDTELTHAGRLHTELWPRYLRNSLHRDKKGLALQSQCKLPSPLSLVPQIVSTIRQAVGHTWGGNSQVKVLSA